MGTASGESDIYFGTDVGKWGAEGARNHPEEGCEIKRRRRCGTTPPFWGSFA